MFLFILCIQRQCMGRGKIGLTNTRVSSKIPEIKSIVFIMSIINILCVKCWSFCLLKNFFTDEWFSIQTESRAVWCWDGERASNCDDFFLNLFRSFCLSLSIFLNFPLSQFFSIFINSFDLSDFSENLASSLRSFFFHYNILSKMCKLSVSHKLSQVLKNSYNFSLSFSRFLDIS